MQAETNPAINCPVEIPPSQDKTTNRQTHTQWVCADTFLAGDAGRWMDSQQVRM